MAENILLYTSVLGSVDYRYGVDTRLVSAQTFCTGQQSVNSGEVPEPSQDLIAYWMDPTFGVTQGGSGDVSVWVSRVGLTTPTQATPANRPIINTAGNPKYIEFSTTQSLIDNIFPGAFRTYYCGLVYLVTSVVGQIFEFANQPFELTQQNLAIRLTVGAQNITSGNLTLGRWYIVEISILPVLRLRITDCTTFQSVFDTSGSFSFVGGAKINLGGGSNFRMSDLMCYTSELSDEQRALTLSYLFTRVATPAMSLPLTWGTCAQPVLND